MVQRHAAALQAISPLAPERVQLREWNRRSRIAVAEQTIQAVNRRIDMPVARGAGQIQYRLPSLDEVGGRLHFEFLVYLAYLQFFTTSSTNRSRSAFTSSMLFRDQS